VRIGFIDVFTNTDSVDGAYFVVTSNAGAASAGGKVAGNSIYNITSTNITLADKTNNTFFVKVNTTNATFLIYGTENKTLLYNQTLPAIGLQERDTGAGWSAFRSTAGAGGYIMDTDFQIAEMEVSEGRPW
jgi:hypothetical protein